MAQVPLFGPLLAGGHNEGLFAVNSNVSGRSPSPEVRVNPLSAVAPGFLRKLFSAGSNGSDAFADGPPATPQATARSAPRPPGRGLSARSSTCFLRPNESLITPSAQIGPRRPRARR